MKSKNNQKAFTIPELLVTITILWILSTVGLLSYVNYTQSARDTARRVDTSNIEKVLSLYKVHKDEYPSPANFYEVVYNWFLLWKQGTFWQTTQVEVWKIFWSLVDPKFWNEYSYSTSSSWKEYQLGVVFEKTEVEPDNPNFASSNLISQSYAEKNPIANYNPLTLFPSNDAVRFWYDWKDIDADGTKDSVDPAIANVGIVENVSTQDFTPFYFDRVIWLDSQDIFGDNSTPLNNEDVTTWKNKTGAWFDWFVPQTWNNHSSPVESTPPSYSSTGFAWNPWVYFNGASRWDRIVVDRGGQPKWQGFSLAYTFKVNDAGWNSAENTWTSHATIISVWPTGWGQYYSLPWGWQLSRDGRANNFVFRINGTINSRTYFNGVDCDNNSGNNTCGLSWGDAEAAFGDWSEVNDNQPHTVFVTYEWNTVTGYLDGTKRFEAILSSSTEPYGEYFRLFWNRAGTAYLEWMLWEVFIASDRMSLSDLEKIEWYFAEKWNWQDQLPADHPYKSSVPQMDGFSQLQYSRYGWWWAPMTTYDREWFYDEDPDLLNSKVVRFPGSMPDVNIEEDNKVHIWRGPIKVSDTWDYTFSLEANDYGFIQIDGVTIVDAGSDVSWVQSGTINLLADTVYDFELVYWEYDWIASFDFRAEWPWVIWYRKYEAFGWNDRSSFWRDLTQINSERQPTYNPSLSAFDIQESKYFEFPDVPYSGSDDFEIFIVAEVESTVDTESDDTYFLENDISGLGTVALWWNGMLTGTSENKWVNIIWKGTELNSYAFTNSWSLQRYYLNAQNYHQNTSDLSWYNSNFILGSNSIGFTWNIKEVIWFSVWLSETERETIEGYLAHKWWFAHNLPWQHPYYELLENGEQANVSVSWDYNGVLSHGVLWDTHVVVASPSIMSSYDASEGSVVDITTLIWENRLVYNGFNNVPSSYSAVEEVSEKLTTKNWFYFESNTPLLFEGSRDRLANYVGISEVDKNVRKIYSSSHLYPYVSYYLDDYNNEYVKDILWNIIGLNPIVPYYCKDILEKSRWINIAVYPEITWSSWDDESEWLISLNDGISTDVGDYTYITNEGENPELTFDWESFQSINLVRIYNSFWPTSQNLWAWTLELLDEEDNIIYSHTFWNTLNVSTIEVAINLAPGSEVPTKMKIRPTLDYDQIALREVEVFAWDDIVNWIYKVDDDGIGGKWSYQVYCDMQTNGWGWTKIGDNFIDNATFRNQIHPSMYTLSNASDNIIRTDISLPSFIQEGSVLEQLGDENSKYELTFSEIPNVEFTSEIRLWAWVRWTSESIFSYSIDYETGGSIWTANPISLKSEWLWRYQEARVPITDIVEWFTWNLWEWIDKTSGIYVTGLDMSVFYK